MSLIKCENTATNKYEIEIGVDANSFNAAINAAYKKNIKKMDVRGFRKGKAPLAIVEKLYGEGVFYNDAIEALYPDAFEAAVKEANLEVVGREDMEITSISKEEGFVFKATVYVKPEVTLGEYKGLSVKKDAVAVTDEELENEIKSVQERNARIITDANRVAELGDTAVLDFEGFLGDVAFEGGKGENYSLELGSGQFIPGFEEQVVGHKAGDKFDITVTFPEEYGAEELAGKEAIFKIDLHEVKVKELPALDDEFAKDVSEFDTLDEYKADMKAKMLEHKETHASAEVEDKLIDMIIADMQAEIPDCMIEASIDQMITDFDYRLQAQGMSMQMYMQYTGLDEVKLRENYKEQATKQVKIRLALEKIAELEAINPSEEEIEAEIKNISERYGVPAEQVKLRIPAEDIAKDLCMNKAIDIVKENAKITKATAKKPAAKKAPAKKADAETAEETAPEATEEKKPAAKKTTTAKKTASTAAKKTTTAKKTTAKKTEDAE